MSALRLVLPLSALLAVPAAHAAQSYDNCTGFIDAVPATITTQGTWCLRHDLSTGMSTGAAITIATNNVTLDCNHFKLGGLPAGPTSGAYGVLSVNRGNVTIRNCTVRGFNMGAWLIGANGGHLVEDNRFDTNYFAGIAVEGDGSIVRRNQVLDTGGSNGPRAIFARASMDVLDNTIANVVSDPTGSSDAWGIYTFDNLRGRVVGNGVRGVAAAGVGTPRGMQHFYSGRMVIRDNDIIGAGSGWGLVCDSTAAHAKGNIVIGFGSAMVLCTDDGNNSGP